MDKIGMREREPPFTYANMERIMLGGKKNQKEKHHTEYKSILYVRVLGSELAYYCKFKDDINICTNSPG